MPKLSDEEIERIAKGLFRGIVADLLAHAGKITRAVDSLPKGQWHEFLDEQETAFVEALQTKFGS